ncbi:carbohydrate-binding module family 24 protein [Neurospora crassa]|uniref:Alpha-1,3-glucanase/mutanase n=1 Tax=Neurospora crassa (strain ATCC 24698 / 74-OR23-1A / CBS 708.71 / DSM 1257 / FGSC 987) TaxID=367110 RepID=A7UXC7_NEUCR|nr:alpha-1,3-glucanase/mutanase [Neurospora crassa OR74A]EDO64915.1 alpha-1,3-glucanase/mutanase [Neurospora crassa OR74A]KHE81014.1 carbohydrate-binding module family 24 protein [Neurospora crassa]|eukprot:XP_001728006.1 alpha-1,3-glucanase/mutanase [Neurospora crassa OR74A]
MRWLTLAVAAATIVTQVTAKAVFAHFMVGNTENYTTSDWQEDMLLAKKAHIDAFALNMAHGDPVNEQSLPAAFSAAASVGMQLFFSFDYAGNGFWPKETVIKYITTYASSSAYYHHHGKPFVSTFEGPEHATDWIDIKSQTSCFFMPDWSSLGAMKAMAAGDGVADGLFSWAAWAWGDWDMYTYTDASYAQYLNGKPYMMPISPWFYTNLPGYNKNWLWRGDRAWGDRWIQAQWWQPEFVQIISWNDYGESHYIAPVREHAMAAFDIGRAPYNYGSLPHDAWRDILPFVIDMYKNNVSRLDHEQAVAWYMLVDPANCDHNGTVANTASQLQVEFEPEEVLDHKIHFIALLKGPPEVVTCNVGGTIRAGTVYQGPDGDGAGMYLGECEIASGGPVKIIIYGTSGDPVLTIYGAQIHDECHLWNGFTNYNAYVVGAIAPSPIEGQVADISQAVCVNGTGMHVVKDLCEFTCSLGYCPNTACVCTRLGKPPTLPKATGVQGYPRGDLDESVSGLCSFACNYGNCSDFHQYCLTTKDPLIVRPQSLFEPLYCTAGTSQPGQEYFEELCDFTCRHGYCPLRVCICSIGWGFANILDPNTTSMANMKPLPSLLDYGLCSFACQRGYCPGDVCFEDGVFDYSGYGEFYDPIEDLYMDMEPIEELSCDPSEAPQTLDDLVNAADTQSIPSFCWNQWALNILIGTLLGLKDEYEQSTKGYDHLFDTYQDWIKKSVSPQLRTFASPGSRYSPGLKYFDCVLTYEGHKHEKKACEHVGLDILPSDDWDVTFTLRNETGFYAEVLDKLGIAKEWITFGDVKLPRACKDFGGDDGAHVGGQGKNSGCRPARQTLTNFPIAIDTKDISVPNPKVVLEAALANMTALVDSLVVAFSLVATGTNEVDSGDIVTAASMPIFMLQQAIDNMNEIKKMGAHIIEENKKKLILLILGIVLMVIPVIGEAGGALFGGIAMVSRIVALIDIAGNVGLTAYDIVEDPASAPFAIMGMLVGFAGGGRSEKSLAEAGKARKAMPPSSVAKLGDIFVENDRKVQKIINACRSKR